MESSGPWILFHCSGTLKVFSAVRWSQITRLAVWVNMEDRSVAGFAVTSQPEDNLQPVFEIPDPDELAKVYEAKTGEIVYEGPGSSTPLKSELCEEGTYYVD